MEIDIELIEQEAMEEAMYAAAVRVLGYTDATKSEINSILEGLYLAADPKDFLRDIVENTIEELRLLRER